MIKARKLQQEDNNLTFASEKIVPSQKMAGQLHQQKPKEDVPMLKDHLVQNDIEAIRHSLEHLKARNERVEALKSQIHAGTYAVNSTMVAQKMAFLPLTRKILDADRSTLLEFKDED